MTTVLLSSILLAQASSTKPLSLPEVGLQMQIPNEWRVQTERVRQVVTFASAEGPVRVEIFSTRYIQPAADWQQMQRTVNEQMERKVERQWEEEILSVPLLMTRVSYAERGTPTGLLVGLLYSNSDNKFHFRLTAPAAGYENAESLWRSALLTLRTTTGSLPRTEDGVPEAPAANTPNRRQPTPAVVPTVRMSENARKPDAMGPGRYGFTVSNRSGVLRFPQGWQMGESDPVQLLGRELPSGIAVQFYSTVDSPPSGVFVMQEINKELGVFEGTTQRENFGPKRNAVGNQTFSMRRTGTVGGKPTMHYRAIVDNGSFYAYLKYESQDPKQFARDYRTLQRLLDRLGLEAAP